MAVPILKEHWQRVFRRQLESEQEIVLGRQRVGMPGSKLALEQFSGALKMRPRIVDAIQSDVLRADRAANRRFLKRLILETPFDAFRGRVQHLTDGYLVAGIDTS